MTDSTSTPHGFVRSPSGNITPIDGPKVLATIAASINTKGVIAGCFVDENVEIHGFVRSQNGSFVPPQGFDAPGATFGTAALSINSAGATTGKYIDANSVLHGFERDADGRFSPPIDAPDAGMGQFQGTRPSARFMIRSRTQGCSSTRRAIGEQQFRCSPSRMPRA